MAPEGEGVGMKKRDKKIENMDKEKGKSTLKENVRKGKGMIKWKVRNNTEE
jgi:hypothetical protein